MFDYQLPPELGCAELYLDREHFEPVPAGGDMRAGDLVWFGKQNPPLQPEEVQLEYDTEGNLVNWRDFPVKHVAINTGLERSGDPLLLHATYLDGRTNRLWPLPQFLQYPRYRKLYGVTRLALQGVTAAPSESDQCRRALSSDQTWDYPQRGVLATY